MEKMPHMEIKCDICGEPHRTYEHKGSIDVEAKKKDYIEQLKKGKPASIEESKEKLIKGDPEKIKKTREKLFKGAGEWEKMKEENIRKLKEGGYKK